MRRIPLAQLALTGRRQASYPAESGDPIEIVGQLGVDRPNERMGASAVVGAELAATNRH
jgi:hypothetical protein